jgi:Fe-S oxidoreductase
LKRLLKWLRRAIRRRKPDIIAVMCPTCEAMMNAYSRHYCPKAIVEVKIIEIGEMKGRHLFKR